MVCLDKYGYPVVTIIGKPVTNLIRFLLHTRKIVRGRWNGHKVVKD